jgi:hypothetical protein
MGVALKSYDVFACRDCLKDNDRWYAFGLDPRLRGDDGN